MQQEHRVCFRSVNQLNLSSALNTFQHPGDHSTGAYRSEHQKQKDFLSLRRCTFPGRHATGHASSLDHESEMGLFHVSGIQIGLHNRHLGSGLHYRLSPSDFSFPHITCPPFLRLRMPPRHAKTKADIVAMGVKGCGGALEGLHRRTFRLFHPSLRSPAMDPQWARPFLRRSSPISFRLPTGQRHRTQIHLRCIPHPTIPNLTVTFSRVIHFQTQTPILMISRSHVCRRDAYCDLSTEMDCRQHERTASGLPDI
jgi:hypothetical protein